MSRPHGSDDPSSRRSGEVGGLAGLGVWVAERRRTVAVLTLALTALAIALVVLLPGSPTSDPLAVDDPSAGSADPTTAGDRTPDSDEAPVSIREAPGTVTAAEREALQQAAAGDADVAPDAAPEPPSRSERRELERRARDDGESVAQAEDRTQQVTDAEIDTLQQEASALEQELEEDVAELTELLEEEQR